MTAICPSAGPSQAKPGLAGVVTLGSLALQSLAVNWKLKWAVPYIVGLGALQLNLGNICVTDPPADPGMTAADGLALLLPQFPGPAYFTAVSKLQQLMTRIAWYEFCQCAPGPTPAAPTAPTAPVGMPDPNPPVTGVPNDACVFAHDGVGLNSGGNPIQSSIVSVAGLNVTGVQVKITNVLVSGVGWQSGTIYLQHRDAAAALIRQDAVGLSVPGTLLVTMPAPPSGTASMKLAGGVGTTADSSNVQVSIDAFCNGAIPTGTVQPCCPPDLTLMGQVQQILQMVTLIQRQNVPFAYVSSTVHAGLTAYGTLAISGLLGVRVDVTAGLATLRAVGNLPPYYFGGGYITFGTADGYPSSYRVKHSPLLCMPARCSAYTALTYDLPPGVTITITELVREP